MIRKTSLLLVIFCSLFMWKVSAQSNAGSNQVDSFYSITRNKAWKVTKFFLKSDTVQAEKKSLFSNVTFRFNQTDSTEFLVQIPGKSDTTGMWFNQYNNTVRFWMPLVPINASNSDSLYNEAANLLCAWPLHKISLQPSLLQFKMTDPFKGEALIELSQKE